MRLRRSPPPYRSLTRSLSRSRPRSLSRSRKANRKPDRSPFPSRNTARTTRPLPPGRIPWTSCAARIQARQEDPDEPGLEPEEDEDAVLPERTPLKQRLSAAVQWVRDRIPDRDLEEPTDAPEEPPEPEPTMDDAAREAKWQCARTHRQRMLLALPALLTVIVAVIDGLDVLSQGWYDHVWLRCGIPAGLLILCLLLCPHLWQEAWEHLRHGRVTAPAAALLCGLVALADSAWCLFLGNCSEFALCRPGGGAAVSVRLRSIPCRPCPVRQLPSGPAGRCSPVCGLRHRRRRLQAAGPSGGLLPSVAVSGPCRPLAAHPDAAVSGPGHGAGPGGGAGRPSDEPFSLAVVGAAVGHGASVPASVRNAAPVPAVPPPAQKRAAPWQAGRVPGPSPPPAGWW